MADYSLEERDTLSDDARIKFSIGSERCGEAEGLFSNPRGMAFDHHRGLLFVVDYDNHRVQGFSCDDGSLMSKFGTNGNQPGEFKHPWGIAIDHDHDRIFVSDMFNCRLQVLSLSDPSLSLCIGKKGSGDHEFQYPRGVAIDKHHHRIIIADSYNHRLVFLSSIDLSFLFSIGSRGSYPVVFKYPSSIVIDHDRHRIIVADSNNHRLVFLSLIDGSFLFEFGSQGNQPGQFNNPFGVCIDHQGRIIVADTFNYRLQAFTHEGHPISSFDCEYAKPFGVAFDEHRGLIAFSAGNQVHVIGANQWIPATAFMWRVDRHHRAPRCMKQAVESMTMIRSLHHESTLSLLPNELLFEIFSFLELS